MRRQDVILAALAVFAVAGWLVFRSPDNGGEKKGILKERIRAADSAMQSLDAERATGRERLRLARKKADENRALSKRAAAALPFYEQRRKEAEGALAAHNRTMSEKDSPFEKGGDRGIYSKIPPSLPFPKGGADMTRERRADGEGQKTADNAALLRRLNALFQ